MEPTIKLEELQIGFQFILDFSSRRNASKLIAKLYEIDWLDQKTDWSYVTYLCEQFGVECSYKNYMPTLYNLVNSENYRFNYEKAQRIHDCGKSWFFNHWRQQKVKGLEKVSSCGDKFCPNCQKLKQKQRLLRFFDAIKKVAEDYDLYHVVLTQPHCPGEKLEDMIQLIFDKFYHLNRILNGNLKIKGLNLGKYGYAGSLRSFECLVKTDGHYHPHLHVIVALKKGLEFPGKHINDYSASAWKGNVVRHFTDFEILIQKIWKLLMTGEKVTLKNIEALKIGYSCIIDKIDFGDEQDSRSNLYEVFKYATKAFSEDGTFLTLDQFRTLKDALYGRRIIQSYGVLHGLEPSDEINETVAVIYEMFIEFLNKTELPIYTSSDFDEVFEDLCQDEPEFRYFSKDFLHKLPPERLEEIRNNMTPENFQKMLAQVTENKRIVSRFIHLERLVEKLKNTKDKKIEIYDQIDAANAELEQLRLSHFEIYRMLQMKKGEQVITPDGMIEITDDSDLPF